MVSTLPTDKPGPVHPGLQFLWYLGCVLTLGYAPKYLQRIEGWQIYDPLIYEKEYKTYITPVGMMCLGLEASKRAKQQKAWDRLMLPLSIITATSAIALTFPSPLNAHWLTSSFYTAAFGLSLEGLLITTYLGSSFSTKTTGRLANGKAIGPVAIFSALPAALATYASLFLLGGWVVMTSVPASQDSIAEHKLAFRTIAFLPVGTMLVCLVVAMIGREVLMWMEARHARVGDAEGSEGLLFSVEKELDEMC